MKRIMVATDFSTRSDRAVRRATLLAGVEGAKITLVHVIDDDQPAHLVDRQRNDAAELLAQAARTIEEIDRVETAFAVATGEPFTGILAAADAVDADLIVVGPHRRQFLDAFTGTTAERTIRRSRRPILMANAPPVGSYARTLLALDLDDASRLAVEAVRRLGLLEQTQLTALHLFDAPAAQLMSRAMEPREAIDHYVEGEEQLARTAFGKLLAAVGLGGVRQLLKPRGSSAAAAILEAAASEDSDLVVVGTNQRGGLARFFLGSVAQEVLLDSDRDVLVVPSVPSEE